jgi:hypothetical protein
MIRAYRKNLYTGGAFEEDSDFAESISAWTGHIRAVQAGSAVSWAIPEVFHNGRYRRCLGFGAW